MVKSSTNTPCYAPLYEDKQSTLKFTEVLILCEIVD